jgi:N6-L-threonylcarbamoyladenine synthase
MNKPGITILAIETSCDETAAAVLRGNLKTKKHDFSIVSSVVHSQIALHKKFGGVVPEVAARAHVQYIAPVVAKALREANSTLEEVDEIAVTSGPGLIVSLMIGVEFAKTLGLASGKKLIPTNHMAGHLYSCFIEHKDFGFPLLAVIVSGGHTMLMVMKDALHYKVIGSTVDDAAGEAFDKIAKLMGLPYPGGPIISKLAEKGKAIFDFPRPMLHSKNYDFSFSGLKTAVRYFLEAHPKEKSKPSFQANISPWHERVFASFKRGGKRHGTCTSIHSREYVRSVYRSALS